MGLKLGCGLGLGLKRGQAGETADDNPAAFEVAAGAQQADGNIPITLTGLNEAATLWFVWTTGDQSAASAASVYDAANGGTPLSGQVDEGSQPVTVGGGPYNVAVGSGLLGNYYFQAVLRDADQNLSVVYADGPIAIDTTVPTISTLSPADGATNVIIDAPLVMTFSEPMKQQGTVTLKNVGGASIEVFDLSTDGAWSAGDTAWTGTPAASFAFDATLAVQWSGLEDLKANQLADNATDTAWNFTAVSAPSLADVIDAAPVTAQANSTSCSTTYTAPASADRMVVLLAHAFHASALPTLSATMGAQAFTSVGVMNAQAGFERLAAFVIKEADIPSGSQTVTLTGSSTAAIGFSLFTVESVDQVAAIVFQQGNVSGTPSTNDDSLDITPTAANSLVLGLCYSSDASNGLDWTVGLENYGPELSIASTTGQRVGKATGVPASPTTCTFTRTSSGGRFNLFAIALEPA